MFQEAHPQKTIGRCPFNNGWIVGCYGGKVARAIAHQPVSCSGVSMGTRNGVLAYAYMMTQHLNPKVRYGRDAGKSIPPSFICVPKNKNNKTTDQYVPQHTPYTRVYTY
jgi:hypothetical protein